MMYGQGGVPAGQSANPTYEGSRGVHTTKRLVSVVLAVGVSVGLVPLPGAVITAASAEVGNSYRDTVLEDDPVAYWRFDETSGTTLEDSSGSGFNGTYPTSGITLQATGTCVGTGKGVHFYGGVASVASRPALNLAGDAWTVEFWARKAGVGAQFPGLLYKHNSKDNSGGYLFHYAENYDVWSVKKNNTSGPNSDVGQIERGSGHLQHVVWAYQRPTISIYVNGTLHSAATINYTSSNPTSALEFGVNREYPHLANAVLDEVAIYEHALSSDRISLHHRMGACPSVVPAAQTRGWGRHGWPTTTRRADPVDTATGAFVDGSTDLEASGAGVSFTSTRTYNSNDSTISPLGKGWAHAYAAALSIGPDGSATFRAEDGQEILFEKLPTGTFDRPSGIVSSLASVTGGFELTRSDMVRYRFNTGGRLVSIKDRSNQGIDFAYDGSSRLSTATDAAGRVFTFSYNAGGKLAAVSAPAGDGRVVSYGYTGDLLTSVTDVRGGVTAYDYDPADRLKRITEPGGNFQVRNTYDANGRVIEQLDPLGNATTFAWDAATQTSTMTDPKGKTWMDVYSGNVLVSTTEPNGTSSVTWDGDLNPTGGTDANGRSWSATYDARGNLVTRTAPLPLSYVETWTYDASNNPLTYVDGRGSTTSYAYDSSGRLITTTLPGGATETRTSNPAGQPATVTDARSNTTTYAYDAAGNPTSVTSATGSITTWTYDTAGRPLTRTEPRGNEPGATAADHTTTWTYDPAGTVLTETDALGRTTTSTYSGTGQVLTRIDPSGRVTAYTYNEADELVTETAPGGLVTTNAHDSRGQLTSVTSPSGAITTYGYDDAGRVTSMVEPRGNVAGATPADYRWSYGYDGAGNQTTITDPLGSVTTQVYDALNRLTSVTDPNGHVTTYGYDANSSRTSQVNHLGHTTTWAYDARNRVTSMTNPMGKIWTYAYDANGNLTAETSPLGSLTTRTYDADNRLTVVVDPLGNAAGGIPADHDTVYGYDPDGNVVSETNPLGAATTFAYDRVGNRISLSDANGHTTSWGFDALNRLASVSAPASGTTTYAYDTAGNLITRTDANTHATTYGYDAEHRLTSLTSPTGQHWTYGYDAAGNRTTTVDAKANAAGLPALGTTTASYDRAGRLVGIDYSDASPDVTYGYDAAGNRTSMVDGAGTETRAYDAADRLTGVTRGADTFAYGYDAAGRGTSRTYPDGTITTLGYDDDGQVATVTAPEGTTTYAYDPAGRLATTTLPNGVVETRTHDNAHRVATIADTHGTSTVASFTYTRDNVGNPTSIVTPAGTETFAYDLADRLVSDCRATSCAPGSTNLTTFTYDGVGNRTSRTAGSVATTYGYDAADQLTATVTAGVSVPYSYDANGRQITAGARSFSYDLAGRLTTTGVVGEPITSYTYDGDGHRLATAVGPLPANRTTALWDPNGALPQVALERDNSGATLRRYTYGLDRIAVSAGGAEHYYLTDGLGSVANLTSSAGAVEQTYTYSPWGETRSAVKNDPLSPDQPMRFAGQQLDPTGLYHLRARQYSPGTARFLTTDPLAPSITDPYVSAYVYVNDRPTVMTDPTGMKGRFVGSAIPAYQDPCAYLAHRRPGGTYTNVGLFERNGNCGVLTVEGPRGPSQLQLNPAEWAYCKNPTRVNTCLAINKLSALARDTAARVYGSGAGPYGTYGKFTDRPPDGSPGNAFQHIVWSALLTWRFGPGTAKEITDRHETDPRAVSAEMFRQMDFANNYYGRALAPMVGVFDSLVTAARQFVDAGLACTRHRRGTEYTGPFVDARRCGLS